MAKNKAKKLPSPKPALTEKNASPLINPKEIDAKVRRKPVLGMTYMKIKGSYSLKDLSKNADENSYEELKSLQEKIREFRSIEDFLDYFSSKHGEISPENNQTVKDEQKRARDITGNQNLTIRHIHCKARGNGKFVLFGFQYENVFEILLLDPQHEISKNKK